MTPSELADLEIVLRAQLGRFAQWRFYDRELKSPMNFVLETAQHQLSSHINVIWAEGAAPEAFCLNGFSEPVVVFNPRVVELWGDVRATFTNQYLDAPLKIAALERLCLQLMAERSFWKHNDPEFAAFAILRASMLEPAIVIVRNSVASMELEPITEVYMTCWFYGLAHELGHFFPERPGFSDELLLKMIKARLDQFPWLPDEIKAEAIARITEADPNFILALDSVREEGRADIFATSVLFESTVKIMSEIQSEAHKFSLLSFICEMFIALNVIITINRCERVSKLASTRSPTAEMIREALLHPVLVAVRGWQVRYYLENAASMYLYGENASDEQSQKVSAAIDSVMKQLEPDIDAMEKAMAAAIKFAARRVDRPDFFKLVEDWNTAEKDSSIVTRFLAEARAYDKWSPYFEAIQAKLENPSAPLDVKIEGSLYVCPFIFGPNDFNRPFDLSTRHGDLIFVFLDRSPLCEKFCAISSESLREGYTVKPALIVADTMNQLEDAIGKRLETGHKFQLVIEGTSFFESCMEELTAGTIWPTESS